MSRKLKANNKLVTLCGRIILLKINGSGETRGKFLPQIFLKFHEFLFMEIFLEIVENLINRFEENMP